MRPAVTLAPALALLLCQAALACPDPAREGELIAAPEAGSNLDLAVVAGGDQNGARCRIAPQNAPGVLGFFTEAPNFTLSVAAGSALLELSVAGDCDATLLVNAGTGWYFDDDEGGGEQPFVAIADPPAGDYGVWVGGFFEPTTCDAVLTVRAAAD